MSLDIFKLDNDVEAVEAKDSVGKFTVDSDVYKLTVAMAYLDQSKPNPNTGSQGGAHNVNLILKTAEGKELRFQEYVTSGKDKGQKNYFVKDGKKIPMVGLQRINEMLLHINGKDLSQQTFEEKAVKVWVDGKETPQPRNVLTGIIGAEIAAGIVEIEKNKYSDPTQKVTENEIDKWFDPATGLTAAEKKEGKTEAEFIHTWKKANVGKVRNKFKAPDGTAGAPAVTSTAPSLFD